VLLQLVGWHRSVNAEVNVRNACVIISLFRIFDSVGWTSAVAFVNLTYVNSCSKSTKNPAQPGGITGKYIYTVSQKGTQIKSPKIAVVNNPTVI